MNASFVGLRSYIIGAFVVLATACAPAPGPTGPGSEDGGVASDAGPNANTNNGSFTCCLNGAFYACPSTAAAMACAGGFDVAGCHAACAPSDIACQMSCDQRASMSRPDTSQCTRTASSDAMCSSSASDGASTTCGNASTGRTCSADADCGYTNHCFDGACYADSAGSPCSDTSQCGYTNHCYATCCYRDASGSPCSSDEECGYASSCVAGECN